MTCSLRAGVGYGRAVGSLLAAVILGIGYGPEKVPAVVLGSEGPPRWQEIEVLVKQLDAPRLADREEAERKLLELGPAILEFLPEDEELTSSEARVRLQRVRQALFGELGAKMLEPSFITLPEGVLISEALQQILLQSGHAFRFVFADDRARIQAEETVVPYSIGRQPFWRCLDQVLSAGGLLASFAPGEVSIKFGPEFDGRTASREAVCYVGPFRLQVVRVFLAKSEGADSPRELTVWIQIAWEPRLRPIVLYWLAEKFEAETQTGRLLRAAPGERTREVQPVGQDFFLVLPLRLEANGPVGDSLKVLRGTVIGIFPGPEVAFSFSFQKPVPQVCRTGDATVILESVLPLQDRTTVQLRVVYGQPFTAFESHRGWFYERHPKVVLPRGGEVLPRNLQPVLQMSNQVAVLMEFPGLAELADSKLVWKIPAVILRQEFPIEFKGVSLQIFPQEEK